ncbi:MAG: hypothetical protein ACI8WB_005975 [Phenylobacterium sp.]|jgi:hypothetical protein
MNRKKKLNDRLKNRVKKTNAKLRTTNKPRYIAKAEREAQTTLDSKDLGLEGLGLEGTETQSTSEPQDVIV